MPRRSVNAIKPYKLKSGEKRYRFQTYVGKKPNGKPAYVTRQGFQSYSEALDEFNKIRAEGTKEAPRKLKLNELYDLWFESYKTTVKESTANKTSQLYKNHIKPAFGTLYLDDITVLAVQTFADQKAQQIVKYKEVVRLLGTLFEYAIRMDAATSNPVKKVLMPKRTARPRRDVASNVYTKAQLEDFLAAASQKPLRIYAYFMILANTGLRKSEALALTWKDIDLNKQTLSVNRTLALGLENQLIVQPPKSKNSKRTVPMSDSLTEVLTKYKPKCNSEKLFATSTGKYLTLNRPASWLSSIYNQNPKLKRITLHGFRHTFATLLAEETNIKPKTLQMLMGHEDISITFDIYAHVNAKNKDDAKEAIQLLNI